MRFPRRGLPLLALLSVAALAPLRVPLEAPRCPAVPSPVDGPPAVPGLLLMESAAAQTVEVDLGRVEPGSHHEVEVAWRRTGRGPLRVLATRTGCGCLGFTGLAGTLAEGASGAACLTLAASVEPGPVDTSACVVLDVAPPGDVLRLRVRAFVGRAPVVRPAWLDFGRRLAGSRVVHRLAVHLPPDGEGADAVTAALVAWPGTVRTEPAARLGQRGPDLLLDTVLPGAAGEVAGALVVRTPGAGETVVPLRVQVVEPPVPRQAPEGP